MLSFWLSFPLLLLFLNLQTVPVRADYTPLIGTNYAHYKLTDNCGIDASNTIIKSYHLVDGTKTVREIVQTQLATMRNNGIQTLRLLIWFKQNGPGIYLPVPQPSLTEPYRSNLINFLTDIKNAGFLRLTVAFAGTVSASQDTSQDTWKFISDVRPLIKKYGPENTRITLTNEGPPVKNQANYQEMYDRLRDHYRLYVTQYGNKDIAAGGLIGVQASATDFERLKNLINIYKDSGVTMPLWFEVHPYGPNVYEASNNEIYKTVKNNLNKIDEILTANNLSQPIVVGEMYYDNEGAARAIKEFNNTHQRQVEEIIMWPKKPGDPAHVCVSPPYSISNISSIFPVTTPTPTLTPTPLPSIPGDANKDGQINLADYQLWQEQYLQNIFENKTSTWTADFNRDNKVDLTDYSIWRESFVSTKNCLN